MFISEFLERGSSRLSDTHRPYADQLRRELGLLDGGRYFGYLLYFVSDEVTFGGRGFRESEWKSSYLMAGGSAERMQIEVRRREDDGVERQYVVGRPHDADEPLSIAHEIGASVTDVHPAELFDADEAAPIFFHYFQTLEVPEPFVLRRILD